MRFLLLFILLITSTGLVSQDILDDVLEEIEALEKELNELTEEKIALEEKLVSFQTGVNFNSLVNYHGRTTAEDLAAASPFATINHKSGLNALAVVGLTNGDNLYDGLYGQVGYKHAFSEDIDWGVFVNKYFYPETSSQINSTINVGFGSNAIFAIDNLSISPSVRYDIASENDLSASLQADYFVLLTQNKTKNIWFLDPSIEAFAGSQNFYKNYFDQLDTRIAELRNNDNFYRQSLKDLTAVKETDLVTAATFKPLSASLDVPINLVVKKINFSLGPEIVFPFNELGMENSIAKAFEIREDPAFGNLSINQKNVLTNRYNAVRQLTEQAATTFVIHGSIGYRF